MLSIDRNKLRRDIATRRDNALSWIVRQLMRHIPSSARKAIMLTEIKQLDKRDVVYVFGSSLSNSMVRDLVQLKESRIAAARLEQAEAKQQRARFWDDVVAGRLQP